MWKAAFKRFEVVCYAAIDVMLGLKDPVTTSVAEKPKLQK